MSPATCLTQDFSPRAHGRRVLGQDCGQPIERWLVVAGRFHLDELRQVRDHVILMGAQQSMEFLKVGHDFPS